MRLRGVCVDDGREVVIKVYSSDRSAERIARVLADEPVGDRYLLPDVVLSEGRFLDDSTTAELPLPVEVVATDGASLVAALRQ